MRTLQRHLHTLKDQGIIEFVERRRNKGRYSSYLYRVLHIVRTTGHGRRESSGRQNDEKAMSGYLTKVF